VTAIAKVHILLFHLDGPQFGGQFVDHGLYRSLLDDIVPPIRGILVVLQGPGYMELEHQDFGSQCRHFIVEAQLVGSIFHGREGETALGVLLRVVEGIISWSRDLHTHILKAALHDLEGYGHLIADIGVIVEAHSLMGIQSDDEAPS